MMDPTSGQPTSITLIILFTDLEGSTRLWQQYPLAMQIALERHDEVLRTAVESADGRIVKSTGDGFYAVFENVSDGLKACITAPKKAGRGIMASDQPAACAVDGPKRLYARGRSCLQGSAGFN
ncbi:MAG: adenylate/guanylate cyclase domain-containing protein [Candidatus Promineifilaceae bacterium]|jgi:class 3 adenylate cyclase